MSRHKILFTNLAYARGIGGWLGGPPHHPNPELYWPKRTPPGTAPPQNSDASARGVAGSWKIWEAVNVTVAFPRFE